MTHLHFQLRIVFRADVLASAEKTRAIANVLLERGGDLIPTRFLVKGGAGAPAKVDSIVSAVNRVRKDRRLILGNDLEILGTLASYGGRDPGSSFRVTIPQQHVEGRGARIIELADALCRASVPLYGCAHFQADVRLSNDPYWTTPAPPQIHEAYWLTILGPPVVKQLGKEHVAKTPAYRVELYKHGSALLVTSPEPAESLSPGAREAQARATAHLRPGIDEAQLLATLLERSAKLEAAAKAPHAPERVIEEPTEWLPAAEALPSDVDDGSAAVDQYDDDAENFIATFHSDIKGLTSETADSFRRIDEYLLDRDYWHDDPPGRAISLLVPAIGAYVGMAMVRKLDGRWIPRRNPDESAVVVGDRAWLPFLRVRRMFQSRDALLAHPLSVFFEAAARGRS